METVSTGTPLEDVSASEEMTSYASGDADRETGLLSSEIQEEEEEKEEEPDPGLKEDATEIIYDTIEERIAAFEEGLAMQCPLCGSGHIKAEDTAKGKSYYKCTNENCNFISWGKPYHISCPECKNPFLIEVSGRDGVTVLKCPRATCRHRQNLAGEITGHPNEKTLSNHQEHDNKLAVPQKPRKKRRVVRRKVVRRKR